MIGGHDTVVEGSGPVANEGLFIVGALRREWPDLVVQDVDVSAAVPADDPSVASMREFFAYKSQRDFEAWRTDGATPGTDDTMIHVMLGSNSVTLVSAGPGSITHAFAARLASEIDQRRLLAEWAARRALREDQPPNAAPTRLDLTDRAVSKGERLAPTEPRAGA